jgi:hypothetical protein
MKPIRLDAERIHIAIGALIAEYPELADDEELRADTLEGEVGLNDFIGRIIRRMQDRRIFVEGVDAVMEEYTARRERAMREIEAHRALILKLMLAADLAKIELPEATVSTRKIAPAVVIDDESALPPNAITEKVTRSPNKAAIKAFIEAGNTVPGARLSNGGVGLTVRVR